MIYLLLKTHKSGLKYFCKYTDRKYGKTNYKTYLGSGIYWRRYLKKHGNNFTTKLLFKSNDKVVINKKALQLSKKFGLKNSFKNNKSVGFANMMIEDGLGGGDTSKFIDYSKSNVLRGKDNWFYGKGYLNKGKKNWMHNNGHLLSGPNALNAKKVIYKGKTYHSHSCLAKEFNINPMTMSQRIKRNNIEGIRKQHPQKWCKKVNIDGKEYRSLSSAARELNLTVGWVHYKCNNKKHINWKYVK